MTKAQRAYLDNEFVKLLFKWSEEIEEQVAQSLLDVAYEGKEPEEEQDVVGGTIHTAITKIVMEAVELAKAGKAIPKRWKELYGSPADDIQF